jgi:hypothetical protein
MTLAESRVINEITERLRPILSSGFGAARKEVEEFERKAKDISRNPSAA